MPHDDLPATITRPPPNPPTPQSPTPPPCVFFCPGSLSVAEQNYLVPKSCEAAVFPGKMAPIQTAQQHGKVNSDARQFHGNTRCVVRCFMTVCSSARCTRSSGCRLSSCVTDPPFHCCLSHLFFFFLRRHRDQNNAAACCSYVCFFFDLF